MKDKKYCKVRYHCHYTGKYKSAVHSTCNLKYSVPKKIPIVFHSESNYDYHFIIKESAVEFKKQFTCLGEETEKYITFKVPIEKEIMRIDENEGEIKNIYILHITFTYYQIFSIELNVNTDLMKQNMKLAESIRALEYMNLINFKDDLIEYFLDKEILTKN